MAWDRIKRPLETKIEIYDDLNEPRNSSSLLWVLASFGFLGFLGQCNSASRSHTHSKYDVHGLSYLESDVNSLESDVDDLESKVGRKADEGHTHDTYHTHDTSHTHYYDSDIPGLSNLKREVDKLAEEVDREKRGVNILGFPAGGNTWTFRDVTVRDDGAIEFSMAGVEAPRLVIPAEAMAQLREILNPPPQQGPERGN